MSNFDTIITRLKLCFEDIKAADATKLRTAYKYPPMTLKSSELPVGYLEPSTMADTPTDSGMAEKTYQISGFVVTHAIEAQKYTTSGYIAEIEQITQIADVVDAYFNDHRRLHTTTAPAQDNLAKVWRDINYRIEIGTISAKGGVVHVGLNIVFTVYLRENIERSF